MFLYLDELTLLSFDCTYVEINVVDHMYPRLALDWLIYNASQSYDELILNCDQKAATENKL